MSDPLDVLKKHLPSLDAAAIPTKCEVFVLCGYEAREMHDAILALVSAAASEGGEMGSSRERDEDLCADGSLPVLTAGAVSQEKYAALGRAAEACGLAWYDEAGEMRFQPPADLIAEEARRKALAEGDQ